MSKSKRWMCAAVVALVIFFCAPAGLKAQTSTSGALSGVVSDASGAVVPGVQIKIVNEATGEERTSGTRADGSFLFPLLPPGSYRLEATMSGFDKAVRAHIDVRVTETTQLKFALTIGQVTQTVTVENEAELLQTESSALGSVTDEKAVQELPLVTRNYTQIIALSSGVAMEVTDARAPGRGNTGESGGTGAFAHGAMDSDNNFEMDGVGINDIQSSGDFSGGVAVPNPDTIQEFKVQTGQYDASFGRNAGAQVSIVTKTGSNTFHGSVFDFFRNTVLNANDYFSNEVGQPRPVMRQNQFGGTVGGPIVKDKLLFFASYQGTRQANGYGAGLYGCLSTIVEPAFTNDRSAAAIGTLFAGQRGVIQNLFGGIGPAIAADGSNINPVALNMLQFKLPDGSYAIPTPQTISNGEGLSVFSVPCPFNSDQFMTNVDYLMSPKSTFSARLFFDNGTQFAALPVNDYPGSPITASSRYWNASIIHTYVFNSSMVNRLTVGFHRINLLNKQAVPFSYSDLGASALRSRQRAAIDSDIALFLRHRRSGANTGGHAEQLYCAGCF